MKAAKALGMRASMLDKLVAEQRKTTLVAAESISFTPIEPHALPVKMDELLDEMVAAIQRFVICDVHTARAAALWCAFTWVINHFETAPLAVITAPEKRCGKSVLLGILEKMTCKPLLASNISPAAVFRVIEKCQPTLLIDEADTFFKGNEELRGVINSGHRKSHAYVVRSDGEEHTPKKFTTWGAKAISGIGKLADTVMDRAIVLSLRRKLPGESVMRHPERDDAFVAIASKLARFAEDHGSTIGSSRPSLPEFLNDRAQDNWEPLLAIADLAGKEWPRLARNAAHAISGVDQEPVSISTELLTDIKEAFELKGVERFFTTDLLQALCEDPEKPWVTFNRGKPMTARQLNQRLEEYNIKAYGIRITGKGTGRGFAHTDFDDAFTRYLNKEAPESETLQQSSEISNLPVADAMFEVAKESIPATRKARISKGCDDVADNVMDLEDAEQDAYEERAAIMEHDAGLTRTEAEQQAANIAPQ